METRETHNNVIYLKDRRVEMKIKIEEKVYQGTPREIVNLLKSEGRFTANQSKGEYMTGAALRIEQTTGSAVRFDSAVSFLYDLAAIGLVEEV